ncbi:MAG: protein kinase [Gemmatimonadaceae bacterium]
MESLTEQLTEALGEHYVVEGLVARGGMSTVFRAMDVKHGRPVAVKVLHQELADGIGADRFLREIQLIARLQHPHILPLFDSGSANGLLYFIMPFVEGETLRGRMEREGPLSVESAVSIAAEVSDALAHAHELDILHRDVKPENILLMGDHAFLSDFGISRAIHMATRTGMTRSGIVVGTPEYMSPEQASGERDLDGRSDIYSLACVLYEMLTGEPPHAGPGGTVIMADRFRVEPKPITLRRTGVPPHVDRAVRRALAFDPTERFTTARAFARELSATGPMMEQGGRPGVRRMRLAALGLAVAAVLAVVGFRFWPVYGSVDDMDASLFVVLPLAHDSSAQRQGLGAEECSRLLFDAFARWTGLRLVDEMRVRDAVSREGGQVKSLEQATRVARRLRAGRLVWGNVVTASNSVEIRAAVYDVVRRSAQPMARENARVDPSGDVAVALAAVADSLVIRTNVTQDPAPAAGSRNLAAVLTYVNAKRALDRWDLDSAYAEFARASAMDDGYAEAHLWAAQLASWLPGSHFLQASGHASSALAAGIRERDRLRAQALLALARGELAQACADYDTLIQRDSADFAAWYGRGECLSRDRVVVQDARSPSGWSFRTSRRAGVDAYARALEIVPSFQQAFGSAAVTRLEQLLLASPNDYIRGFTLARDTVEFAAYPGVTGDTLSAVPWLLSDFLKAVPGSRPSTYRAAVDRNRGVLVQLTERWVADAPETARARESYALALENVGRVDTARGVPSALGEIRMARRLEPRRAGWTRFPVVELRLLLKLGRWSQAKALSDSLLLDAETASPLDAGGLSVVALLTGRSALSAELAKRGVLYDTLHTMGGSRPMPAAVADETYALAANVFPGGPAAVTRQLAVRARNAMRQSLHGRELKDTEELLLAQTLMFAYPETGALPEHNRPELNTFLAAEAAHARGDVAQMRGELRTIAAGSADVSPGDYGPEFVFLRAWLLRASGDTTGALAALNQYLTALPSAGRNLLRWQSGAGGLVRVLMLRADLAHGRGDSAGAAQYAAIVRTLWQDCDAVLQPHVARMRTYGAP